MPAPPAPGPPPRHRPLVGVAAAFAGGIWIADSAGLFETPLPEFAAAAIAIAVLLSFAWAWRARGDSLRTLPVLLGCLGLGLLRIHLVSDTPPNDIARFAAHGQPVRVRGILAGDMVWTSSSNNHHGRFSDGDAHGACDFCRFPMDVSSAGPPDVPLSPVTGRIEVTVLWSEYKKAVLFCPPMGIPLRGAQYEVLGQLRAIRGGKNPGQGDSRRRLLRAGVAYRLTADTELHVEFLSRGASGDPRDLSADCRSFILDEIRRIGSHGRGVDGPESDFLACLLLGERQAIDKNLAERFLQTGTIHYLAVSGMHVILVMLPIEWLLWWFRVRGRAAVVVLVLSAVGYAFLTGLSPSVVRAAVMYVCVRSSILVWRRSDTISALAAAAILILAFEPGALWNAGFQLSFVSVLALICVAVPVARLWLGPEQRLGVDPPPWHRRLWTRIWRGAATLAVISLVCWCSTVPIVLRTFHIVSPIALLANILVAVPMELLIIVGMSTIALGMFWAPLATPGIYLVGWLISLTDWLLTRCLEVPGNHFYWPAPWDLTIACWYAGLVGLLCWRRPGWPGQHARTAAVAAPLAVAALLGAQFIHLRPNTLRVTALDVGQGNCTLLEMPDGATYLYDCGTRGDFDVGRRIVAEALWARGITRLDGIILSHGDSDHSSGVNPLVEVVECSSVHFWKGRPALVQGESAGTPPSETYVESVETLSSRILQSQVCGVEARTPLIGFARSGVFASGSGWAMEVVSDGFCVPLSGSLSSEASNNSSVVLRVTTSDGHSVLLPGDIEQAGIQALLDRHLPIESQVLLAPHHGSPSSWDPRLWEAVRPQHLLVSGDANFPSLDVLEEYRSRGTKVWWTAECGAVTLTAQPGGGWKVETFLPALGAEQGSE